MPAVVDLALTLAVYFLFPVFYAHAAEAGEVTEAFWDRELIDVPRSSNLSATCSVVGADRSDVIRVVHSYRDKTLLLADNDVLGPTFARLPRYHVTYRHESDTALVTVNVNGVRGEDTGILACQRLGNDDIIAYVDVVVYVPANDVHVTSIAADGSQSAVEPGGDVYLRQGASAGVGCAATTDGSRRPASVSVRLDDHDVTPDFNASTDVEAGSPSAGLAFYRAVTRLSYVTSVPDRRLHRKQLVCTASTTGFDDVNATSLLLVQFAPVVTCPTNEYSADMDSKITITCTVSANPSSQVTWSAVLQSDDDYYAVFDDAAIRVTSKALTETDSSVSLHVLGVARRHARNFTLLADNALGSDSGVVTLSVVAPPSDASSQRHVDDNDVVPDASRPEPTRSSSTAVTGAWRRSTTTVADVPHDNASTSSLRSSSVVVFVVASLTLLRLRLST